MQIIAKGRMVLVSEKIYVFKKDLFIWNIEVQGERSSDASTAGGDLVHYTTALALGRLLCVHVQVPWRNSPRVGREGFMNSDLNFVFRDEAALTRGAGCSDQAGPWCMLPHNQRLASVSLGSWWTENGMLYLERNWGAGAMGKVNKCVQN